MIIIVSMGRRHMQVWMVHTMSCRSLHHQIRCTTPQNTTNQVYVSRLTYISSNKVFCCIQACFLACQMCSITAGSGPDAQKEWKRWQNKKWKQRRGRMGWKSEVDVKLSHTRWWVSFRETRGGDTLASVFYLRQCVLKLSKRGLSGYDGARLGSTERGEDCGGKCMWPSLSHKWPEVAPFKCSP